MDRSAPGPAVWSGCHRCRRRQDCPYFGQQAAGEALLSAVCQEQAAARLLRAEADRLSEAIASASDIRQLLQADKHLEQALDRALRAALSAQEGLL